MNYPLWGRTAASYKGRNLLNVGTRRCVSHISTDISTGMVTMLSRVVTNTP